MPLVEATCHSLQRAPSFYPHPADPGTSGARRRARPGGYNRPVTFRQPKRGAVPLALFLGLALALGAAAQPNAPERPSGRMAKQSASARHQMVAAANPLATDAGDAILRRGGTAIDAAIAVQMVLNLVEPQSSGIGGGAFMLVHDARRKA